MKKGLRITLYVLGGMFVLGIINRMNGYDPKKESNSTNEAPPTAKEYTILDSSQPGNFKNYEILIDSSSVSPNSISLAVRLFKASECNDLPCNVIGVWDNEKAYALYKAKSDNPSWRKEYWPYVCEHYVADYNATVNELNLSPFVDSEYRRWGGKKKRPVPHSFEL